MALDSVSVTIRAGEFAAIVGPSGSGKSTLLAIAGTLERPTSGQVRINGSAVDNLRDCQLSALRAYQVGFVFQQFFLAPSLTALDNVASGLLYQGTPAEARRRAATEALCEVGLGHRLSHRPAELSGGECQRVAIARAMVKRPPLLLADEPTGNVDSRQSGEIMALFSDLHNRGTTILVVTHNTHMTASLPRVIRLRDGLIEDDSGTPA
jgi:putative ABC transport system ATP-binding protein